MIVIIELSFYCTKIMLIFLLPEIWQLEKWVAYIPLIESKTGKATVIEKSAFEIVVFQIIS